MGRVNYVIMRAGPCSRSPSSTLSLFISQYSEMGFGEVGIRTFCHFVHSGRLEWRQSLLWTHSNLDAKRKLSTVVSSTELARKRQESVNKLSTFAYDNATRHTPVARSDSNKL
jgi:hypothetical protein